jgi:hypothetical protein
MAPLPIVSPTDSSIPPYRRYVFVNDRDASCSQHATHFVQDQACVVCVMQYITKQYGVETLIPDGKMAAIVRKEIDASCSIFGNVQSDDGFTEHALQVVCDEAVAATDVEYTRVRRQHAGDFERHIISSTNLAAPARAFEATFDGCG